MTQRPWIYRESWTLQGLHVYYVKERSDATCVTMQGSEIQSLVSRARELTEEAWSPNLSVTIIDVHGEHKSRTRVYRLFRRIVLTSSPEKALDCVPIHRKFFRQIEMPKQHSRHEITTIWSSKYSTIYLHIGSSSCCNISLDIQSGLAGRQLLQQHIPIVLLLIDTSFNTIIASAEKPQLKKSEDCVQALDAVLLLGSSDKN